MKITTQNLLSIFTRIRLAGLKIKKRFIAALIILFQISTGFSQELTYDNFEGSRSVNYAERTGVLDLNIKNPKTDSINKSAKCAMYIRNAGKKFDNIKMELPGKLAGVNAYATYLGTPSKLKMKIYTSAPIGTLVEILLGNKNGNNDYPAGTNSQYQVYTTVSNQWEVIEFKFSQIPQGSQTSVSQIDQVTLLFNPNSTTSDTYYFDEITGPAVIAEKDNYMATPKETNKKPEELKRTDAVKKAGNTTEHN